MPEGFEKIEHSESGRLESRRPEVLIEFAPEGEEQKFIVMTDKNNSLYIASYPAGSEMKLHMHALMRAVQAFKEKGIQVFKAGGGFLKQEGSILRVYGESGQLGPFDKEKVTSLLSEAFPQLVVQKE